MVEFLEVQLPPNISYGARGGAQYSTTVLKTASGHEMRNIDWSQPLGEWDLTHGMRLRSSAQAHRDLRVLIRFFHAVRGRAYGFRFKDWADYEGVGEPLGTGDGVATLFPLIKREEVGAYAFDRTIAKPVHGTVRVYADGSEMTSGWSVDTTTGLVTFSSPPAQDVDLTADFEFDKPARLDTDLQEIEAFPFDRFQWGAITLVEVRP